MTKSHRKYKKKDKNRKTCRNRKSCRNRKTCRNHKAGVISPEKIWQLSQAFKTLTQNDVPPDLLPKILLLSRRHPLAAEIRERGQENTQRIQNEIDHINEINEFNRQSFRNAIQNQYPHLDVDNLPNGIILLPYRQMADPIRRFSRILE